MTRKGCLFLFIIFGTAIWIDYSAPQPLRQAVSGAEQSASEKREAAFRENNLGVALLEQYKAREAAESFNRALEIKPDLLIARINLSIALYYLSDISGAKREAEKAVVVDRNEPHPNYILGLIARGQNRFADAIADFERVLQIDGADVGSNINIGQIFVQQKNYAAAIAALVPE